MTVISASGSSYQPTPDPNTPNKPATGGGNLWQIVNRIKNFALQNGTPVIATYNTPNDGQAHSIIVAATLVVTSVQTGGAVQVQYTFGGNAANAVLFAGGVAAPGTGAASAIITPDPGTPVVLLQSSAQTAGAATVSATISAA